MRAGVALVSTGGSARAIADAGLPVTPVEQVTGFPECLDGRVKTLHPSIHGGLLADTRLPAHLQQIADLGIEPFDLVVVNLYPFRETVAAGASFDECVEQIDIGGPAMIRASAKNHPSVAVVVDPSRYPEIETAIAAGGFTLAGADGPGGGGVRAHRRLRRRGGVLPERRGQPGRRLAGWTGATWDKVSVAALRREPAPAGSALPALAAGPGVGETVARQGDELQQLRRRRRGLARGQRLRRPGGRDHQARQPLWHRGRRRRRDDDVALAHQRAHACDPVSAFGGVIAVNRPVTAELAEQIAEVFTEVLLAPGFSDEALSILTRKKNIRLLVMPADSAEPDPAEFRAISGGLLVQTAGPVRRARR